jgi:hypothetical protein
VNRDTVNFAAHVVMKPVRWAAVSGELRMWWAPSAMSAEQTSTPSVASRA